MAARTKDRHRLILLVCTTIVALLVAGTGAAWAFIGSVNARLTGNIDPKLKSTLESASTQDPSDPFYMLLLGIDKDEDRAADSSYGESDNAYRSDSIMLVRLDPKSRTATLVSIHRDTLVNLGTNGKQKINAAYSIGGAAYATQVISDFAGVPISHYAEVDMDGLAKVVDAVGGITVDLPVPVKDPEFTGLDLPEGEVKLDGQTAALLCRARHAYDKYGDGDLYRAANQRSVITAVVKKVLSSNLATMASTVSAMADMVHTDMDLTSILALATQYVGMDMDKGIMSGMAPTTSAYKNDTWYEICDTKAWQEMMHRVDQGLSPLAENASSDADSIAAHAIDDNSQSSKKNESSETQNQSSDAKDQAGDSNSQSGDSTTASFEGDVLVYNGSGTNGAARSCSNKLEEAGFSATPDNLSSSARTTAIYYNANNKAAALGVAQKLGLDVQPQENNGNYTSSADVIVILGSDLY